MKIPLSSSGLISSILSHTGGQILYEMLHESAKKTEARFDRDQIPEHHRIGAKHSKIFALGKSSYSFTLERCQGGAWALTHIHQETKQN